MPLLNLCNNLTSLITLSVYSVKDLTFFPDEMLCNVSLQHLCISDCREFQELPQSLYNLHSLRKNYLTSLQSFRLWNCDGLTSLPSGMLEHCRSLKSLKVFNCNNLISFPLHIGKMPSLSYLNISQCPKLIRALAGGLHHLIGLLNLEIGPFSEMVDFEAFQYIFNGIQQLVSLRRLCVFGHLHWDSLPYQLMQLSDLRHIHIYDFGIQALPYRFENLTSLETLELRRCKRLQHLYFSDAMPKLQHLHIQDCPLLDGLGNLVSLQELVLWTYEKLEHLPSKDKVTQILPPYIRPFSLQFVQLLPMLMRSLRPLEKTIATPGCGILAIDESNITCGKRLVSIGLENTEANHQAYRTLLVTAPALYQSTTDGQKLVDVLVEQNIVPGIKVDKGLVPLAGSNDESWCQGLDGITSCTAAYYQQGARFAKWRTVVTIPNEASALAVKEAALG
ncbi:hypothetical protein EJD97_004827 [Solanum chilense]|uniref:fructose-bisphosphate aldolase n=1 Tax=Solanum chilense TaxID=4083 RepID=A0A6N2BYA8_SOLCI|nr:hypothetical protein EJD97_004827 [Solanum chilense]